MRVVRANYRCEAHRECTLEDFNRDVQEEGLTSMSPYGKEHELAQASSPFVLPSNAVWQLWTEPKGSLVAFRTAPPNQSHRLRISERPNRRKNGKSAGQAAKDTATWLT